MSPHHQDLQRLPPPGSRRGPCGGWVVSRRVSTTRGRDREEGNVVGTVIENRSLGDVLDIMGAVRSAIEGVIEGKRGSIDMAMVVLLAEGHLLLEDVPG